MSDTASDGRKGLARPMTRKHGLILGLVFVVLFVADLQMTQRNRERRKKVERRMKTLEESLRINLDRAHTVPRLPELKARIAALETENAALKARVAALEGKSEK